MSRAKAHIDAGNYDSAIADYTEAIRLDPKDELMTMVLGNVCWAIPDFASCAYKGAAS
jgi:Flp pilus assembly protein TadD